MTSKTGRKKILRTITTVKILRKAIHFSLYLILGRSLQCLWPTIISMARWRDTTWGSSQNCHSSWFDATGRSNFLIQTYLMLQTGHISCWPPGWLDAVVKSNILFQTGSMLQAGHILCWPPRWLNAAVRLNLLVQTDAIGRSNIMLNLLQ
jgi:hypothetical protein